MIFCERCGNAMNDGAAFCTKCGSKVQIPNQQQWEDVYSETIPAPPQPMSYQPSNNIHREKVGTDEPQLMRYSDQSYQNIPTNQIPIGTNTLPPVIEGLSQRLKKKANIEIGLAIMDLLMAMFLFAVGVIGSISLLILAFIFLIVAAMNFYSAYEDKKYRKEAIRYPVGIIEHYEEIVKKFLMPNLSISIITRTEYKVNVNRIRNYILLNRNLFEYIEMWFKAQNNQNGMFYQTFTPEQERKIEYAFTAQPDEPKETNMYLGVRTVLVGLTLAVYVVVIPLFIGIYDGSNSDTSSSNVRIANQNLQTSTQTAYQRKTFNFTAEEFINRYNAIAGSAVINRSVDFSKVQKEKTDNGDLYCFFETDDAGILILFIEGDSYLNNVSEIKFCDVYVDEEQNSEVPVEFTYCVQALYPNLSLKQIEYIADTARQCNGSPYTDSNKTPEINFVYDVANHLEVWDVYPK